MCVIAHCPEGVTIDWFELADAYFSNPDGCGLVWRLPNGKVRAAKGLWKLSELERRVGKIEGTEFALHLRICTHGPVNDVNCHPFYMGGGNYVLHNGVLPIKPTSASRSDTAEFAREYYGLRIDDAMAADIEAWHGPGNRMLWAGKGEWVRTGNWVDDARGVWWSNRNHDWRRRYQAQGAKPKKYVWQFSKTEANRK